MAKAAINKTFKLSAQGILSVSDDGVSIENPDTGELIDMRVLLAEFADKSVKMAITYDYDYDTDESAE